MTKDASGALVSAFHLISGGRKPATADDVRALRLLIDRARACLKEAEDAIAAATPTSWRAPSKKLIEAKRRREAAASAALSIYDIAVGGQPVGDIWYSDLVAMRRESAFAASLADQLLRHTTPTQPMRVRDMVSQRTLSAMVNRANAEAGGIILRDEAAA